jgi:hypothetical protein
MSAGLPRVMRDDASEHSAKRRQEVDAMLTAIVDAIAAGKLPPDDAAAWAKIAAYEVEMCAPELNVPCPS